MISWNFMFIFVFFNILNKLTLYEFPQEGIKIKEHHFPFIFTGSLAQKSIKFNRSSIIYRVWTE